uniref:Uncharacterized protein n=1 Tax=Rhizophora mucronata TaxID=61149 RepID=A0A2P2K197_RHIMU
MARKSIHAEDTSLREIAQFPPSKHLTGITFVQQTPYFSVYKNIHSLFVC